LRKKISFQDTILAVLAISGCLFVVCYAIGQVILVPVIWDKISLATFASTKAEALAYCDQADQLLKYGKVLTYPMAISMVTFLLSGLVAVWIMIVMSFRGLSPKSKWFEDW
jgi:hypothetical protein